MNTIEDAITSAVQWNQSSHLVRHITALSRAAWPVVRLGNEAFVFRYSDVVDVLSRDQDFGVTPVYASEMAQTSGNFFLGMEDGPRYARERGFANLGDNLDFLQLLEAETRVTAAELLRDKQGKFDFVQDFARELPYQLLRRCFGIPGPSPELMKEWLDALFWDLFLNLLGDRDVQARARRAGQELRRYLLQRIAEIRSDESKGRKRGQEPIPFLPRLVASQEQNDDLIVRTVTGVAIGAFSTQAKALTLVLQELLSRPEVLAEATEMALSNDSERLCGYVFEALRFNPHNPLVVRYAMQPTKVGRDVRHPIKLHTGARVFALTLSASFDPAGFPLPDRFDPTRPFDSYLHFGYGMHRCFGAQMVKKVLTAAMGEVLRRGVRATKPAAWAVKYRGPFPTAMPVTLGAGSLAPAAGLRRLVNEASRYLDHRAVG